MIQMNDASSRVWRVIILRRVLYLREFRSILLDPMCALCCEREIARGKLADS